MNPEDKKKYKETEPEQQFVSEPAISYGVDKKTPPCYNMMSL